MWQSSCSVDQDTRWPLVPKSSVAHQIVLITKHFSDCSLNCKLYPFIHFLDYLYSANMGNITNP